MVDVAVFKTDTANALATVTSDSGGVFTTGNIATGGVPIDGYIRGMEPTYRSSYIYPPSVVDMSLTGVPVLLVSNQAFGFVEMIASVTQDDDNNGVLLIQVADCTTTPMPQAIDGATVMVQQSGTDVGTIFDLGALAAQAAGTFFVFNVPDGATQVLVSYNGMNFPSHTVMARKRPAGPNPEATVTVLAARPGL
jgi:hypothetical protein